ncbi:hypothetical protein [Rhodococcus opacus]|uniref:hypothetical protein n=1 Tax=Rhodococcus opacus TaxID=37919 RepID=UPI000A9546CE|nr:hypothetical protein [Rhodococcus opacus]
MTSTGAPALVDVHAHFVTDRYIAAARAAGHHQPDGMPGWPNWNVAGRPRPDGRGRHRHRDAVRVVARDAFR